MIQATEAFNRIVSIGKRLTELHVGYENAPEYALEWQWTPDIERSWRVEKMRLTPDKTAVIVNESLTLAGVPPECFQYRLGDRSALEWVIDQYQVSTDKRSGIVSDPNRADDPEYIARLVCRVAYVSVETVKLQRELATSFPIEEFGGIADLAEDGASLKDYWQECH